MKNPIPLLVILLLLWIILLGRTCNLGCCGDTCPVSLSDGDNKILESEENYSFNEFESKPNMPVAARNSLEKIAAYLIANPTRQLTITGQALENELDKSPNIGNERANEIMNYLTYLGAPAGNISTSSSLSTDLEQNDKKICGAIDYAFSEKTRTGLNNNLSIIDGTAFSANETDNLKFAVSDNNYYIPYPDKVKTAFTNTGAYLQANPEKVIEVTGYYRSDETNGTAFPDLGVARANKIKELLISLGAPKSQIELRSQLINQEEITFDNDLQVGMSSFNFLAKNADNLEEVKARILGKKLTLYFETNAQTLNLTTEQRQFFSDLNYYLDRVDNAKIITEGHTDNKGDTNYNRRLSRKRSEFVQDYLIKNGIRTNQVQVAFQGPDSPIADNETEEGRALNRRVEVFLQN